MQPSPVGAVHAIAAVYLALHWLASISPVVNAIAIASGVVGSMCRSAWSGPIGASVPRPDFWFCAILIVVGLGLAAICLSP